MNIGLFSRFFSTVFYPARLPATAARVASLSSAIPKSTHGRGLSHLSYRGLLSRVATLPTLAGLLAPTLATTLATTLGTLGALGALGLALPANPAMANTTNNNHWVYEGANNGKNDGNAIANKMTAASTNNNTPSISSSLALVNDPFYLGLFIKAGFAMVIGFDEKGFYRGGTAKVNNTFDMSYAPTFSIGYDFNRDYSAEVNFLFYTQTSRLFLNSTTTPLSLPIRNYIFTVDQSFHGINIGPVAVPLRLGVGALFWAQNTSGDQPARQGNNFLLKIGSGIKFNIINEFSIFSTMDIESRFDYYVVFGDRRNTNTGSSSELLLTKDFASGGIGIAMIDFKLGF